MNITQERYSLLELWLESFRVINRCVGKLLGLVLLAVIVAAVMSGSFTWIMHKLQTGYSASTVLPFVGMAIALSLFYNLSWLFGWVLLTRVISDQATQEHLPFYELASSSIIPTLKLLVAGILFAIPLSLVGGLISFLPGGKILSFLFLFAIGITLGVRLIYTFMAIALKEQGPVSGFSYSWKLTKGAYIDTLLMCIVNVLTVMLVQALLFLLLYAMYTLIPLKFADSFSLAHLSPIWWSAAGVFGIIAFFLYVIPMAFPVLVFINRSAVLMDVRSVGGETTFVPLPDLDLTEVPTTSPEHAQMAQSTGAPSAQHLEEWQVSQSSVNTSDTEVSSLSEHLDKVYKPQQEDVIQYADEDRMPTILFDDEMAKQLEENQAKFAPRQKAEDKPEDKDEGPQSIKMSKF